MIFFKNISYQVEIKELFDDVSFSIFPNQKIGLVGKNGIGKSTLFKLITGALAVDKGDIETARNTRIVTVKQEVDDFDAKVIDYVVNGIEALKELKLKMNESMLNEDFVSYSKYHEEYESLGGYTIEAQAGKLLSGLGFKVSQTQQKVKELSGGWQIRLNLAQALLQDSDILLLDEPTNHLDLDAVLWLEQYLQDYKGSLLLISHDRIFLDNVVKQVFHIDNKKIVAYTGNYSSFEKQAYEQKVLQQKHFEKQQKHIAHLESFINRFKAKASKAKQAQSRVKMLDKIQKIEAVKIESDFSFEFKENKQQLGGVLVSLDKATLGYGKDNEILEDINLNIYNDMRVGLLGLNGAGKSTLIKSLIGELDIMSGNIKTHPNLKVGYFSQHSLDMLDMLASPLLHFQRLDNLATQEKLRTFLGSFNFTGDKALASVGTFSGGEKARLALAMIVYQEPNFLLLDEPTNHLDIGVREALTVALQGFEGAIILVSHDRFLLESTVDEYMLVGENQVKNFDGDMHDYYKYILDVKKREFEADIVAQPKNNNKKEDRKLSAEKRKQLKPLQDKVRKLEKSLDRLQQQNSKIEQLLQDEKIYDDKGKLQQTLLEHTELKNKIEEMELEWFGALEELEEYK